MSNDTTNSKIENDLEIMLQQMKEINKQTTQPKFMGDLDVHAASVDEESQAMNDDKSNE